jgi:hypothetical protein
MIVKNAIGLFGICVSVILGIWRVPVAPMFLKWAAAIFCSFLMVYILLSLFLAAVREYIRNHFLKKVNKASASIDAIRASYIQQFGGADLLKGGAVEVPDDFVREAIVQQGLGIEYMSYPEGSCTFAPNYNTVSDRILLFFGRLLKT